MKDYCLRWRWLWRNLGFRFLFCGKDFFHTKIWILYLFWQVLKHVNKKWLYMQEARRNWPKNKVFDIGALHTSGKLFEMSEQEWFSCMGFLCWPLVTTSAILYYKHWSKKCLSSLKALGTRILITVTCIYSSYDLWVINMFFPFSICV